MLCRFHGEEEPMTHRRAFALLAAVTFSTGCGASAETPKAAASPAAPSEEDKTLYAMGLMLGRGVAPLKLTPTQLEQVSRGMVDAATGKKPEVELQTYGPKVQQFAQERAAAAAVTAASEGKAYEDKAAAEAGAVKLPSGLVFKTVTAGSGASPAATDVVRVHYHGTLVDGTVFDSSVQRGQPAEFPLNRVIPCWTEGVQRMKVGEKARLVCPASIAYGERGSGPIPGGATLTFEVELLEIKKADAAKAQ
jgi:FKBP-type peptidyl-prolyl cis-trans isomerase FkpA